jgi:hypothetical protein
LPLGYALNDPASGAVWQAGWDVAKVAYISHGTISVEYTLTSTTTIGDRPVVMRINAPCLSDSSKCLGQ